MLLSIQTKACIRIFTELCKKATSIVTRFLLDSDITMGQLFFTQKLSRSYSKIKERAKIHICKRIQLKTCF